ncbi:DUF4097 family beta strand repeat-containing protein [Paenibacillus methanolicus]|uniref:DUF4097 and DUF4098 domain-containing protein YvlB n=1 Tax=Paenibacillus methanolicus TaxID=582686 RepID=A0A5S5BR28_9BACL|nr:DUF4097 family beta strand repeat-containing protein [Paenibacillus methanolicus]TYP68610.1 DUF4097 and DUF4098 domain-containing protein YvlB [Paenibacillus methanolicus]
MERISRRKAALAVLAAFVCPGAGHLLLGLHMNGLLLLAGTLADILAMIHFADLAGGRFALLLVYLGLAVPAFWFYSVFGTLQEASRQNHAADVSSVRSGTLALVLQGAAIALLGAVMLVFLAPPKWLAELLEDNGNDLTGIGLIIIALNYAFRRRGTMLRTGRITAALLILTVGGLLLSDQMAGRNDIALLGRWWPAAFVLLGVEVIVYSLAYRKKEERLPFDLGGSFMAAVIAVTAFSVTQYAAMPFKWLDQWNVNMPGAASLSEENGFKYDKEKLEIPLGADMESISINNPNGSVTVLKGEAANMTIETIVWIDAANKQEADEAAAASVVEIGGEKKIAIEAKGKAYGADGSRLPRMNVTVTVPADSHFSKIPVVDNEIAGAEESETLPPADSSEAIGANEDARSDDEANGSPADSPATLTDANDAKDEAPEQPQAKLTITAGNGAIRAEGLFLPGGLAIQGTNGEIQVSRIVGSVDIKTKNGAITVDQIAGDANLEVANGDISARQMEGKADVTTSSGSIRLEDIRGEAEVETKNGQITVAEAASGLRVDTLNGEIDIRSSVVGGDWNIDSSIGDIRLYVPETGGFSVNGSVTFGTITTDLPLEIGKKTVRGSVGDDLYRIDIDANSSIAINRYLPSN